MAYVLCMASKYKSHTQRVGGGNAGVRSKLGCLANQT